MRSYMHTCLHTLFLIIWIKPQGTLIFIMTVVFFLHKKNSSSNFGAKMHRFGLCSQRSVSIVFFYAKKKMLKKDNHFENESSITLESSPHIH